MERIIYDDNYTFYDWKKDMEQETDYEGELDMEEYISYMDVWRGDEKMNLDVETGGVVVAFARLGLWNGSPNGARICGTNVNSIFETYEEYNKYYCDRYNVRADLIHHDGTNRVLYRVVKDMETAERLVQKIAYEGMDERRFMKATKSLRPYVAKVYGW